MKNYQRPVMEIDLFEDNGGLIFTTSACGTPPSGGAFGYNGDTFDSWVGDMFAPNCATGYECLFMHECVQDVGAFSCDPNFGDQ